MSILVRGSDKQFTPAPEGLWPAVCCDVVELGIKDTKYGPKEKIRVHWELDTVDQDREGPEGETMNHTVVSTYNATLGKGSRMRKDLESWRGKPFTGEELAGFDIEKLIGVNCQILVKHNMTDEGQTFANAEAVLRPKNGEPKMRVSPHYVRFKDRDEQGNGGHAGGVSDENVPF